MSSPCHSRSARSRAFSVQLRVRDLSAAYLTFYARTNTYNGVHGGRRSRPRPPRWVAIFAIVHSLSEPGSPAESTTLAWGWGGILYLHLPECVCSPDQMAI